MSLFTATSGMAVTVKSNTIVPISINNNITSKNTVAGSSINATIIEDVKVKNKIVFKAGDRAILNILSTKKASFVGIAGEIIISGGKVFDINGEAHRFEFSQQVTGDEKTWPKVCLGAGLILLPLALFGFVKGGQAKLTPAQILDVRLTSDFDI